MTKPIQTVLRYPGAKWVLASWIVDNLPAHNVYVEPFFGSGAVLFRKPPARTETVNDIDGDVVNLFQVIRNQPDELCRAVALTPWARDEYRAAYVDDSELDEVERARLFLVRCWQAFGSKVGPHPGWRNRTTGKSPCEPDVWVKMPTRIRAVAERLLSVQIENCDALTLLDRFNAPNVLVYADPPYMEGTRQKRIYAHEIDTTYHEALLNKLSKHQGAVVLSGYDHELYNDKLSGWRRVEHDARNMLGNQRREILWIKDPEFADVTSKSVELLAA